MLIKIITSLFTILYDEEIMVPSALCDGSTASDEVFSDNYPIDYVNNKLIMVTEMCKYMCISHLF